MQQGRPVTRSGWIGVVVVDDHETVRTGVRVAIEEASGIEVIGEAATARDAVDVVRSLRPDVVVVDLSLPDRDGVEVCRDLRSSGDTGACVVLTSYASAEAQMAAAVAGAGAFVPKTARSRDLVDVIRRVAAGETLLDAQQATRALAARMHDDPRRLLSPQERRVMDLIAHGLTNRQIGAALHLTEKTVKNYVSRLLAKLDLSRRTEAAVLAARLAERDRAASPWRYGGPERDDAADADPEAWVRSSG